MMETLLKKDPLLPAIAAAEEVVWINPKLQPAQEALAEMALTMADIRDAEARLARFAPFIKTCFPETAPRGGLIESPRTPIPNTQAQLLGIPPFSVARTQQQARRFSCEKLREAYDYLMDLDYRIKQGRIPQDNCAENALLALENILRG